MPGTQDDLSRLASFLRASLTTLASEREPTLFAVGGRGHFENPITDLLAFFLNPVASHGLGDVVLRAFLRSIEAPEVFERRLVEPPRREERTINRNRIDLLLIGPDWVMAVENKVQHVQVNPFDDYEHHLAARFPHHEARHIVLSPAGTSTRANWKPLAYRRLIDEIRAQLDESGAQPQRTKWLFFLEEFLLHLENETTEHQMTDEHMIFAQDNYALLTRAVELRHEYHRALERRGLHLLRELFPEYEIRTKVDSWDPGPAIRYFADRWGRSNACLHIGSENGRPYAMITLYATDIPAGASELANAFGAGLNYWTESANTWHCWSESVPLPDHTALLARLRELVNAFDNFLAEASTQSQGSQLYH